MTAHPGAARLQDYLDDLLCREERTELEAHLAACQECTAEVLAERELRRALTALPRAIEPERDLLAGINAAIDAEQATSSGAAGPVRRGFGSRPIGSLRYPLAAAALALVALTALLTTLLLRSPAERAPSAASMSAATDPVVREVLATEASYLAASRELEAALSVARAALDPATVAVVESNLLVVERALAEARAALRQDPNNAMLAELVEHARAQKLELLRRATRAGT